MENNRAVNIQFQGQYHRNTTRCKQLPQELCPSALITALLLKLPPRQMIVPVCTTILWHGQSQQGKSLFLDLVLHLLTHNSAWISSLSVHSFSSALSLTTDISFRAPGSSGKHLYKQMARKRMCCAVQNKTLHVSLEKALLLEVAD